MGLLAYRRLEVLAENALPLLVSLYLLYHLHGTCDIRYMTCTTCALHGDAIGIHVDTGRDTVDDSKIDNGISVTKIRE